MPGQYYEGVRRDDPATGSIKRLMLAVLEDALRCLQTYAKVRTPIRRRMFVEAQAWISNRTARPRRAECRVQGSAATYSSGL